MTLTFWFLKKKGIILESWMRSEQNLWWILRKERTKERKQQHDTDTDLSISADLAKEYKDYSKECAATGSLLVVQGSVTLWWPTSGRGGQERERVCVYVCVWGRERAGQEGSQLISCITAVIFTLFITGSMCSVRFKIFKSVICQHYEVNTHSQAWCPIRHHALHFTWPHIYHDDLTWLFVVPAGKKDFVAGVCDFSSVGLACCWTLEKNYGGCMQQHWKARGNL